MSKQCILLNNATHRFDWLLTDPRGQLVLQDAYDRGTVPRCRCKAAGVEMYIAQRGSTYYLAKLPDSGFLHASDCPSASDGGMMSGLETYAHGAVLKVGTEFAVTYTEGRQFIDGMATSVTCDGLLDLLMEQAGMNVRYPDDQPHWSGFYPKLREASGNVLVNGALLENCMLVPEFFDRNRLEEIDAYIEPFIAAGSSLSWVCAPLKSIASSKYGWQIKLKHLPRLVFWVTAQVARRVVLRSSSPLDMGNPPETAMCMMAIKHGREHGGFTVTDFAVRPTDAWFYPAPEHLGGLLSFLLGQRAPVIRPLRYDSHPDCPMADFGLIKAESITPAFRISRTEANYIERRRRAYLMKRNHTDVYIVEV